jgi:mannose-6-phosphate isomerase-like protein (cupin superfamily)
VIAPVVAPVTARVVSGARAEAARASCDGARGFAKRSANARPAAGSVPAMTFELTPPQQPWTSVALADVAGAVVKVLRMDGRALPAEVHREPELLLVLDGVLELELAGEARSLRAGQGCTVPAEAWHTVRPGSRGTLLIVESAQPDGPGEADPA